LRQMDRAFSFLRGLTSTCLFAVFGLGALLVSPVMLVLRRPEFGQPVVRALWRPLVALFELTGLIRVDRGNLPSSRGVVLAANHPSLIDVVLVLVLVPRTLYVAKRALRTNPFMAAIVRATSLPDDASLPEVAARYLAAGWNVLVFPEGTRSPASGMHPFRRGAAQIAMKAGAPVVPLAIVQTRRILAKWQMPWEMGPSRVLYEFRAGEPLRASGSSSRGEAVRLTAALRASIEGLLSRPHAERPGRRPRTVEVAGVRAEVAETFAARARGLIGREKPAPGEGLLITRCNCIHTFFMSYAIDAAFLDADGRVVKTVRNITPWRFLVWGGLKARSVLETAAAETL